MDPGIGYVVGGVVSGISSIIGTASRVFYEIPATLELQRQQFAARISFDREQFEHNKMQWIATQRSLRAAEERNRKARLDEIVHNAEVQLTFNNWPLKIAPSLMRRANETTTAPYVVLALPAGMPEKLILEEKLRKFFQEHYKDATGRPVEFLGAGWNISQFRVAELIKQTSILLATEPTLILEAEQVGPRLLVRVGFWGAFGVSYTHQTVAEIAWATGSEEERAQAASLLAVSLAIAAGNFADGYHRFYRGQPPVLPAVLSGLLNEVPASARDQVRTMVKSCYSALFARLAAEAPTYQPEIDLELGDVASALGDPDGDRLQLELSLRRWAEIRSFCVQAFPGSLEVVLVNCRATDRPFLQSVERSLGRLGETREAAKVAARLVEMPDSENVPPMVLPATTDCSVGTRPSRVWTGEAESSPARRPAGGAKKSPFV